jgi:hypothetical protein
MKTKTFISNNIQSDQFIASGILLHHFGLFNQNSSILGKPMWVSDIYSEAKEYQHHAINSGTVFYSTLNTSKGLKVADMSGVSLMKGCMDCGFSQHHRWNDSLCEALLDLGYDALVYAGREILIASPEKVLLPIDSSTTWP